MIEKAPQCKFIDESAGVKCNQVKALAALKAAFENAFGIKELREIMCDGSVTNKDCLAYRNLEESGNKSDFAKATA
jgi:hypothetical protein